MLSKGWNADKRTQVFFEHKQTPHKTCRICDLYHTRTTHTHEKMRTTNNNNNGDIKNKNSPVFLEREAEHLPVRVERAGGARWVHLEAFRDGVLPEVVRIRLGQPEVHLDVGNLTSAALFLRLGIPHLPSRRNTIN